MTDKKDKLIQKLASIVKKQQALLNKVILEKVAEKIPGDPLDPDIGDYKGELFPKAPKPAPKPSPKPVFKPDTNKADMTMLPHDLKSALDVGAPHLKGALNLEVSGNTVNVRYNADKLKGGGSKVQQAVQAALAGTPYTVVQCIGDFRPGWHANYA